MSEQTKRPGYDEPTRGPWKTIPSIHGGEYLCVELDADTMYTTLEMKPLDAHLMAAAPELLAALEERVASFWGDWDEQLREAFRRDYFPDHPIAAAEDAIRKARGK